MPSTAPGKRQRKIILSDDDEQPIVKTRKAVSRQTPASNATSDKSFTSQKSTPKKSKAKPKSSAKPSANAIPKASPSKAKKIVGKEGKESKSLHNFFGRATEEQRWARKVSTPPSFIEDGEPEDAIEDDSFDEAFNEVIRAETKENEVLDRRKTPTVIPRNGRMNGASGSLSFSQQFAKTLRSPAIEPEPQDSGHGIAQPWAEAFAPSSLEELAVHKKKVKDVQDWLSAVFQGRARHRLLVLKGPAGSGKSTTVSLLSKTLKFSISHWRNPSVSEVGVSYSSQFDDFLDTSSSFSSLSFSTGVSGPRAIGESNTSAFQSRILLVEDFPSTNTSSGSTLASFRKAVLQYLAESVPPLSRLFTNPKEAAALSPPLVLVVSESLLTSATASTDSFTAHRLLGPEICNHPYATILEFNPVAPTLIKGALDLVMKKEARVSKRRRVPGAAVLKQLSALGDVRSAVNGLEFLCVRGDSNSDWGGRTASKVKGPSKASSDLTQMERDSLELVTQREATLGIFHAVGKVVWNKRQDATILDPKAVPPPRPPEHLSHFDRPKVSQVAADDLLNEIGTDISTFIAALHENYVLSTNGSRFTDSASDCVEALSQSDILSPGSRQMTKASSSSSRSRGFFMQPGGVDMLRQNEISFQVAVRGLLFSLPSPVSRAPHLSGRRGDSFKMFYPASLKTWKETEEINDLISLEMDRLSRISLGITPTYGNPRKTQGGIDTWKARIISFEPTTSTAQGDEEQESQNPRIWLSRDELLLDRLPYSTKSLSSSDSSSFSSSNFSPSKSNPNEVKTHRQIQEITQFTGRAPVTTTDENDDLDGENGDIVLDLSGADVTTDHNHSSSLPPVTRGTMMSPRKFRGIGGSGGLKLGRVEERRLAAEQEEFSVEKLYIEEDDIEDDE